jgi:hypothetical protein
MQKAKRGRPRANVIPLDERRFDPSDRAWIRGVQVRLKEYLARTYRTVTATAKSIGVNRATATNWHKGRGALPESENLLRLAASGLSLDWLLTGLGQQTLRGRIRSETEALELLLRRLGNSSDQGESEAAQAVAMLLEVLSPVEGGVLESLLQGLRVSTVPGDKDAALAIGMMLDRIRTLEKGVLESLRTHLRASTPHGDHIVGMAIELLYERLTEDELLSRAANGLRLDFERELLGIVQTLRVVPLEAQFWAELGELEAKALANNLPEVKQTLQSLRKLLEASLPQSLRDKTPSRANLIGQMMQAREFENERNR